MYTTVKERIVAYLTTKKISTREFERTSGLSNGYLKSLRANPSADKLSAILKAYPDLNRIWLLTGEGSMLVSSSHVENPTTHEKKSPSHADESTKEEEKGLKYYYEMDATAGDIEDLTDNEIGQPYRILTIPGYEGCTAFNVRGESMLNVAKPGDIVAVEPNPADIVVNGEIYLVVTKDGQRMIKRCIHLPDTQQLRCISDTPRIELFPPTDIATERVHRIFRVRGFVSLSLLN